VKQQRSSVSKYVQIPTHEEKDDSKTAKTTLTGKKCRFFSVRYPSWLAEAYRQREN